MTQGTMITLLRHSTLLNQLPVIDETPLKKRQKKEL